MRRRYPIVLFLSAFMLFFCDSISAQNTFTIGYGTGSNTDTEWPAPYGQFYTGARHVFIYRRQELIDSGWTTPRQITQLGFNVTSLNGTVPHQGFTVRMKFDPAVSSILSLPTGMATVYYSPAEMPVLGWNMLPLSVPMVWDTTKGNIIVEVCFSNGAYNYTRNASTQLTSGLPVGSSYGNWSDQPGNGCPDNGGNQLDGWSGSTTDRPNIRFDAHPVTPMTYDGSLAESIRDFGFPGKTNQKVVKFIVNTTGALIPFDVTSIDFNTTGSTDAAGDLTRAKIYYTGLSDKFDTTGLFGQVASPNGSHTITGVQQLKPGVNYFWLTYDINSAAPEGDVVDGEITSLVVNSASDVPAVTSPAGIIPIGREYNFDGISADGFLGIQEGQYVRNEWERGVPVYGPTNPVSGPNCWGTNLSGDYSSGAAYSLVSPSYVVTDTLVITSYKEWFDFSRTDNQIYATFDYQINYGGWSTLFYVDNFVQRNSNDSWGQKMESIVTNAGDTIQFRWAFQTDYASEGAPGWYIDNFGVSGVNDMSQVYQGNKVDQPEGPFNKDNSDIAIMEIMVNTAGSQNPLYLTDFEFTTNGTTSGILDNAKVYYTGVDPNFTTTTQVGSTVMSPSGTFTVSDSIELFPGVNYFWLAYNVNSTTAINDMIDAECNHFVVSGITHFPGNPDPEGYRAAGRLFNFDTVSAQGFYGTQDPGNPPNQWEKGIPTMVGPSSSFSGTDCWGTNLSGFYGTSSNYFLISPSFVVYDTLAGINYKSWNDFGRPYNDVFANLEYQVNNGGWSYLNSIDNGRIRSNGWEEQASSLLLNINDTIQFRWSFQTGMWAEQGPGWYIDDVLFSGMSEIPQFYRATEGVQRYKVINANAQDAEVLKVEITVTGTENPLEATSFEFNTGSSVAGIISDAKLFYTGNIDIFGTANQVGTTVSAPSGTFTVTGSLPLLDGKNYFWLTYSLNGTEQINDSLDAEVTQVTINSIIHTPSVTAPAEQAYVGELFNFDTTASMGFSSEALPFSSAPNQWEKGTPTDGPVAYSGNSCWGTILGGDYVQNSSSVVVSPPMLVKSDNVAFEFKQWFDFAYTGNDVYGFFEYQVNNSGWNFLYNVDITVTANSNNQWQTISDYISTSVGDTIQFRWRFETGMWIGTAPGWYIDNFMVGGVTGLDQGFITTTAIQDESTFGVGSLNEQVLKIEVEMQGTGNPFTADAFDLDINGSAVVPGFITEAKLFYTGTESVFNTATQFGSAVSAPTGPFTITGSQQLASGINYFWLTYSIDPAAAIGDSIDGEFLSLTLSSGAPHFPVESAPSGNKKVGRLYDFESATDDGFSTMQTGGMIPSEWQRGVLPAGTMIPGTAYSGTKAWKTNLSGVYGDEADYALLSPIYVATSSTIDIAFKNAFHFGQDDEGFFEYQVNNGGFFPLGFYNGREATWQTSGLSFATNINDTVQFRWRIRTNWGDGFEGWVVDNFVIHGADELPMLFLGNTVEQYDSYSAAGFNNQGLIRLNMITNGSVSPKTADYFKFSTTGTTDVADITTAKVYYTGSSARFNSSSLFGQVTAPSGSFVITGSQQLQAGDNYFWLAYDVSASAVLGNELDAEVDSIGIDAALFAPVVSAPSGTTIIGTGYTFEAPGTQNFTTEALIGINQWQKGTPSGGTGAPAAAYGGTNCWGTNLSGNYDLNLSYALVSPTFVATAPDIIVSFKQFFNTYDMNCGTSTADLIFEVNINNTGWNTLNTIGGTTTQWEDIGYGLTNSIGDTIVARWVLTSVDYCTPVAGWYIDDVLFSAVTEIDVTSPLIEYTPISNTSSLANRTLTGFASITDLTGVDSTTFAPRIYYKKYAEANIFGANTNAVNGWKYAEASNLSSPFNFTIDYSLLNSALAVGDTIQYFVTAQDVNTPAMVGASPSEGFNGTSVSTIANAPSSPSQFLITLAPMSGTYNVGAGQIYTSITNAVNDLNIRGMSGAVTFALTDNSYTASTEIFPISINNVAGSSAINTITVKPTLPNTLISGNSADGIFKLNQARYVKLNGAVSGSSKDLTVENMTPSGSAVVWFASDATGCMYDSVMNCNIKAGSSNNSTSGIRFSGTSPVSQGSGHQYNAIVNNHVFKAYSAIVVYGASNISILSNTIGSSVTGEKVKSMGIELGRTTNTTVKGNTIEYLFDNSGTNGAGIRVGMLCQSISIENNKIDSLLSTTTNSTSHQGIAVYTESPTSDIRIVNNFVSRIYGKTEIFGIVLGYNSGNVRVYNNTVNLVNSYAGSSWGAPLTCLLIDGGNENLDIRNNIFHNSFNNTNSSTSKAYAIMAYTSSSTFDFLDYNNYTVGATKSTLAMINGSDKNTLAALRLATAKDVRSSNNPVFFVSDGDLHLTGTSIGDFGLVATPLASVPEDIDGQTRNLTFPYKGADENAAPLPVKLNSFIAVRSGEVSVLKWTTASEINNSHFVIERSIDMNNFRAIGEVKGAGNSNVQRAYSFTDRNAAEVANKGIVYYRLRQVDVNGASEVSKTVAVNFNEKASAAMVIYPNPFVQEINLTVESAEETTMQVTVTDLQGRVLIRDNAEIHAGTNTVVFDKAAGLSQGIYIIRTEVNGNVTTQKLIKTDQ